MKKIKVIQVVSLFLIILFVVNAQKLVAQSIVDYVEPMAGTGSATTKAALKHAKGDALNANTIPAVTTPFAMTQWTPQTQTSENKCIPPYFYKDNIFNGIRGSHWLSGSCTQDYGSVTIMPITGKLETVAEKYGAKFEHNDEHSAPYEYGISLKRYNLVATVTSTNRCGIIKITAKKTDSIYILITPNSDYNVGYIKVDEKTGEISGYNPVHRIYQGWGKEAGFDGHFAINVDRKFTNAGTFGHGKVFTSKTIKNQKAIGVYLGFKIRAGETIQIKVGTSFSNLDGARKNLHAEMPDWDYARVLSQNRKLWEKSLSQIQIKTNSEKDKRIFYTAYYHTLQQPRLYNDVDGVYPKFASDHQLAKLEQGNYFDDFSLWDTYRAQLPLLEIIQPEMVNNVAQSLITKGQQGGYLPIFPCWNSYTSEMIGDHCSSVIVSAYLKGIDKFDVQEGYRLMRQNAFILPEDKVDYIEGKGRRALTSYLKYKYIPLEDSVPDAFHKKEQVSRVLEYAYDDFALAQMARKLGKTADDELLSERAGYYKNVFDTRVGLVRGRYANGQWVELFNPDGKESYITEGTPRQYSFYVPQDIKGLSKLMGGDSQLELALDTLFLKNEYWHGNEPGHQIPFLYNFTNSPWKSQLAVRNILSEEYSDGPGGLSGNDDAGQMSAWYMFSAMGFYPVNPVSGEYLLCAPLFDRTLIKTGNNKTFLVETRKSSPSAAFIKSVSWNGKEYDKNFITYNMIKDGGSLMIYLQDKPSRSWGIASSAQPYSMSR